MNELYHYYEEKLGKFNLSLPCLYRVARYTLGHRVLVLMCESEDENLANRNRVFLACEGLEYMQLYPMWRNSPLHLASPELRSVFLEQAGIEPYDTQLPMAFYASPFDKKLVIVCARIDFSERMPQLPEYQF